MKTRVFISFSKDSDLKVVEIQLKWLASLEGYEFVCCFLPRHIIEDEGMDLSIVNLLQDTLGDRLTWLLEGKETFKEASSVMDEQRQFGLDLSDKMYVLDSKSAVGVKKEVEIFTNGKVILL